MKKLSGIIFSNIYDAYLGELTAQRTVASLPFGGRYRQIDFVLSNMVIDKERSRNSAGIYIRKISRTLFIYFITSPLELWITSE